MNVDPDTNMLHIHNDVINQSDYYSLENFQFKYDNRFFNYFSLLNVNIRSISKNINSFLHCFENSKFILLSLTETWLNKNNVSLFNIPGYKHEYNIRSK